MDETGNRPSFRPPRLISLRECALIAYIYEMGCASCEYVAGGMENYHYLPLSPTDMTQDVGELEL